ENRYRRKDGTTFTGILYAWAVKDQDGRVLYLEGFIEDIEDRKRAVEQLRESEETARTLLNASPAVAFLTDTTGVIIAVNEVGARLLDKKAEGMVGRRLEECFPVGVIQNFTRQGQEEICPGDSVHFEKEYLGRFFDVTIHPVVDQQGSVARFAVFGTDITGRKRAEEALRQSETQLRMITNALPTLVAYIDSNQKYLFNNSAYQDWTGYSLDKITGKNVKELFPEDIYKDFQPYLEEALSGKRVQFETKIIHPKFGLRYVSGTYLPDFGDGGVLKGFVTSISDVTETKLKEEYIRASLNEKVTLLREIHHRVKNNLQIMSGLLELSGMKSQTQECRNLLRDAQSRIHSMAIVHSQLYQSERFTSVNMEIHLMRLVEHLCDLYACQEKHICTLIKAPDVYLTITQAIPCALICNELVSNCLKYAFPGHGRGTLEVTMGQTAETLVTLRVKDDGVGLPEDVDVVNSNTLGLELVGVLIDQIGGRMKINRSKGTEIIIEFQAVAEGQG
ncbi:MAG: PAS domain S-box protein, partial [Deltaproteobacteria bacterium]|nr:PAS domain S-box protein [Deltaproteobacteria bacterium]